MADKFPGFELPKTNFSKLPHQLIDALPLIETVSEMKVILYVLRHTWGFQEFDELKRITLDEFQRGRKRKDGSRLDKGTGLSANAIKDGIARAIKHRFLIQVSDGRDFGRSSHVYQLRVSNSDTVSDPDSQPSKVDSQPSDLDTRSEKDTPDRNSRKKTPSAPSADRKPNGLLPDTQESRMMFGRLQANAKAQGRRGPGQFKTLEQKRKFDEAAAKLDGQEFERALTVGLEQGINSVARMTNWIAKWDGNRQQTPRHDPGKYDRATCLTLERLEHHGDR